jgi:predicted NAD/FAD-dependent oxidoreductase
MDKTIAIIGAGMAGLMTGRVLRERGANVIILEKSRGLGGRLATKRVGPAVFDLGAQFFTISDPGLEAWLADWRTAGIVSRWSGAENDTRWIGRPTMTAVAKRLAEGLEVKREHKVTAAARVADGWELTLETHGLMRVDRLVSTAPVPQTLMLLKAGGVVLKEPLGAELARVSYHPCLALLVVLDRASATPMEGVSPKAGPLRWIADNAKKGISAEDAGAMTLLATPAFSAENYGRTEDEIAARLLPAAREFFGEAAVISAALHRWRYSEATSRRAEKCVWLPEMALGLAGDAFGGPGVEGAALSGLALAARIGDTLAHEESAD